MHKLEFHVKASELAKVLNLSVQRINQLCKQGVFQRESDGKFYVPDCCENYYRWKLTETSYNPDRKKHRDAYQLEHARFERIKRMAAELELGIKNGDLLRAEDVEQAMATMIADLQVKVAFSPEHMRSSARWPQRYSPCRKDHKE